MSIILGYVVDHFQLPVEKIAPNCAPISPPNVPILLALFLSRQDDTC